MAHGTLSHGLVDSQTLTHTPTRIDKMSHQKKSVTMEQNVTKWGKKEHKMHQVKMLQRDKMSQFMGKIGHKTHQDKL
jgi:hypothetical protein